MQEVVLISGTSRLAEVARAVDVGRHLVGNELRDLRIVFPGLGYFERLVEFRLVCALQLGVIENILAIIEREHIAVVEEAPDFAFVGWQGLEERMIVREVRLVEIFRDEVVQRCDHTAIGQRGRPRRLDVEDVVGPRGCNMLGHRLRILVGMGEFYDIGLNAGQLLPQWARKVARIKRLQTGFIGHVQGHALILLCGLDRDIGRPVCRSLEGGFERRRLSLAERRRGVGEFCRRLRQRHLACRGQERAGNSKHAGHLAKPRDKGSSSRLPFQPGVDIRRQTCLEVALLAIVHCRSSSIGSCRRFVPASPHCLPGPRALRLGLSALSPVTAYVDDAARSICGNFASIRQTGDQNPLVASSRNPSQARRD